MDKAKILESRYDITVVKAEWSAITNYLKVTFKSNSKYYKNDADIHITDIDFVKKLIYARVFFEPIK